MEFHWLLLPGKQICGCSQNSIISPLTPLLDVRELNYLRLVCEASLSGHQELKVAAGASVSSRLSFPSEQVMFKLSEKLHAR